MKKLVATFLFLLLLLPSIFAEDYYADISIGLDEKGTSHISGRTDYPNLNVPLSDDFTSKKGQYWLFNLSTKEVFSDYYISVIFPKNIEINYINVDGSFRISEDNNLEIIAAGSNSPIEFVVQYRQKPFSVNFNLFYLLLVPVVFLAAFLLFRSIKKNPKKDKLSAIMHTLTDNQKLIVKILVEAKAPITQKQILHRSNLPKATLSRNLELLRQKKIINKESRGMVNVISLNKE